MRNSVGIHAGTWLLVTLVTLVACSSSGGSGGQGDDVGEQTGAAGVSASAANAAEPSRQDTPSQSASGDAVAGERQQAGQGPGAGAGSAPPESGEGPVDDGTDAGNGGEQDAGAAQPEPGDADSDDDCVVAIRLDTCCGTAAAASPAELAADECLVPWLRRGADRELATRCLARSPINCAAVLCAVAKPPSRRVARDQSGVCGFRSDCEQDSDCVLAYEAAFCCACLEGWPATVVAAEACVVEDGQAPPADAARRCSTTCPGTCGACAEPVAPSCTTRDGLRACR
jgi:hypothetical protein